MSKVTYIFGAGASREVVPVVEEIPNRLRYWIRRLNTKKYHLDKSKPFKSLPDNDAQDNFRISLIKDFQWMLEESKRHASVDTFAKKLTLKNDPDLKRLKIAMSAFFTIEQMGKPADLRYDAFFASILQPNLRISDDVKIISWNYDFQMEIALTDFNNIHTSLSLDMEGVKSKNDNLNGFGFSIFKLNGSAKLFNPSWREYIVMGDFIEPETPLTVAKLVENYAQVSCRKSIVPTLSFAWEKEELGNRSTIADIKDATAHTTTLIIIGYSFPFFNREIDRDIINNMSNLEWVYIQNPEAESIKESFLAIRDNLEKNKIILLSKNLKQFHLPPEL